MSIKEALAMVNLIIEAIKYAREKGLDIVTIPDETLEALRTRSSQATIDLDQAIADAEAAAKGVE